MQRRTSAIYCRIHTIVPAPSQTSMPRQSQGESTMPLETQRAKCLEAARASGYACLPENMFLEDGRGDTLDRPKLNQLRDLVYKKQVDAVFCESTSRLSRDRVHLMFLAESFEDSGVDLIFVSDGWKLPRKMPRNP